MAERRAVAFAADGPRSAARKTGTGPARAARRVAKGIANGTTDRITNRTAAPDAAPFADDYLVALLAQASFWISAEFHRIVREQRLLVAEWRILASLAGAPPMPVGRLAQTVLAPQPTVTRQLDRMQTRGLVERVAQDGDRRVVLVQLAPVGRSLAKGLIARARAHEQRVLAPLGERRAALLKATIRELLEQHRPEPAAGRR